MKTFVAILVLGASVILAAAVTRRAAAESVSGRLAGSGFETFCHRHGDELTRALDCDVGGNALELGVARTLVRAKQ